jgi:hypothetical protein
MIIRPGDVHENFDRAKLGVGLAAEALGIKCNLQLMTMWKVDVDGNDAKTFIEFAREFANNPE